MLISTNDSAPVGQVLSIRRAINSSQEHSLTLWTKVHSCSSMKATHKLNSQLFISRKAWSIVRSKANLIGTVLTTTTTTKATSLDRLPQSQVTHMLSTTSSISPTLPKPRCLPSSKQVTHKWLIRMPTLCPTLISFCKVNRLYSIEHPKTSPNLSISGLVIK